MYFTTYNDSVSSDTSKQILSVTVKLVTKDCTGEINITDVMLQGGKVSTLWSAHPSEIKWSVEK